MAVQLAESDFSFENSFSNLSDDELYKVFMDSPTSDFSPNGTFEGLDQVEFPDLSSMDLSEFMLVPVKQEPISMKNIAPNSIRNGNVKIELQEGKRKSVARDVKLKKKAKIIKQEFITVVPRLPKKDNKRLQANKKSAQASRERKKALKNVLEQKVDELNQENSHLSTTITELETENKVLKNEFIHLHQLIGDSSVLSKLMDKTLSSQMASTSGNNASLNSNTNSTTSAFLYMMIVLYSFNQHFRNVVANVPNMPIDLAKGVPTISTVA